MDMNPALPDPAEPHYTPHVTCEHNKFHEANAVRQPVAYKESAPIEGVRKRHLVWIKCKSGHWFLRSVAFLP